MNITGLTFEPSCAWHQLNHLQPSRAARLKKVDDCMTSKVNTAGVTHSSNES